MKKRISTIVLGVTLLSGMLSSHLWAENLAALKIGMAWPSDIINENSRIRLCGDAGVDYGTMFDRKFAVGFAGNFMWNRVANESADSIVNGVPVFKLMAEHKSFMFPLGAFFVLDPLPEWFIRPSARFQIGYNSLVYGTKDPQRGTQLGYYFGLYIRTGLDASINMGETTSLFAGADYQWAKTRTVADKNSNYKRRDMSGFGIHLGFRALY